jgi:hypothetical protein
MPWNDIEIFVSKPKDFQLENSDLLAQIENILQVGLKDTQRDNFGNKIHLQHKHTSYQNYISLPVQQQKDCNYYA